MKPEDLTDEDIRAEMKRCLDDEAQARSMIEECKLALRGCQSGRARIAHSINERKRESGGGS